jgi:hypothetical protein
MYNFLVKKGTTVAFLLGLFVIAVFLITTMTGLSGAGYDMSTDLVAQGKDAVAGMNFFNTGLGLTLALIFIAVLAMFVFGILGLIKFPKSGMKSIAVFGGLIVGFFILKALAPDSTSAKMMNLRDKFDITDSIDGFIGGGILTTLCLIGFAALAMVVFEIRNAFK